MLSRAIKFAVEKHENQYRKGHIRYHRMPYVVHPIRVLHTVWKWGTTEIIQVAAVLHDTLEDTKATESDIKDIFGDEVCKIVQELTYDPVKTKKEDYMASFGTKSLQALVIKVADRLDNTIDHINVGNLQHAKKYYQKADNLIREFYRCCTINTDELEKHCQYHETAIEEIEQLEQFLDTIAT